MNLDQLGRVVRFTVVAAVVALPASAGAFTVFAAKSLSTALPAIDASPTYSFAGSDTLERQIAAGAPADVFASASPRYTHRLYAAGRCGKPVTFATNVLVLITPTANPAGIHSINDLAHGPAKRLAIGSTAVPVGIYTRILLRRLSLSAVLTRNTVSSEPDVGSIVSKVALGSADAGIVYYTDWKAASDRLALIRVPKAGQPSIRYEICAVRRSGAAKAAANRFIRKVLSPAGRRILKSNGFGLPPLK